MYLEKLQIWSCCRGMLVEDDAQFEAQLHSQLARILDRHLSAPRAHLADLHIRFRPLLTPESVTVKDDFDALCERVVYLQGYLKSVLEEPPEVVHSLVVLRKEGLIRELERIAKGAIQVNIQYINISNSIFHRYFDNYSLFDMFWRNKNDKNELS